MIIVTVEGKPAKRYVIAPEDEYLFAGVPNGKVPEAQGTPALGGATRPPSISDIRQAREDHIGRFHFGCQWLRGPGRIDECYRTLGTWEITSIKRTP